MPDCHCSPNSDPEPYKTDDDAKRLCNRVNAKLMEGDVAAAVRAVASDDSVLHPTEEVLTALRSKHPDPPADLRPTPLQPTDWTTAATEQEMFRVLKSFPASSSVG